MAKQFLVSIDLNKNEIQNFVVHTLATAPATPVDGQAYFNSTDNTLYMRVAGVWVDITGKVRSITSNTTALTIDNADPSNPAISIADASGVNSGLLTSAFFTDLTNATNAATANTLVKRDVNGDVAVNVLAADSMTIANMGVGATDVATKGYVDGLVTSAMKFQGVIDASTNPLYPADSQGDVWQISVAGLVGGVNGVAVEAGDMVVCTAATSAGGAEATVGADYSILQNNTGAASTTVAGTVRLATGAEVTAGTAANVAVTPADLASAISGVSGGSTPFTALVGDGALTSITVSHNLANQFCMVQVFDAVSNAEVIPDITLTDANTVTLNFTVAPTLNQYRVVVIG